MTFITILTIAVVLISTAALGILYYTYKKDTREQLTSEEVVAVALDTNETHKNQVSVLRSIATQLDALVEIKRALNEEELTTTRIVGENPSQFTIGSSTRKVSREKFLELFLERTAGNILFRRSEMNGVREVGVVHLGVCMSTPDIKEQNVFMELRGYGENFDELSTIVLFTPEICDGACQVETVSLLRSIMKELPEIKSTTVEQQYTVHVFNGNYQEWSASARPLPEIPEDILDLSYFLHQVIGGELKRVRTPVHEIIEKLIAHWKLPNPANGNVAVVGPSNSGKTSLMNALKVAAHKAKLVCYEVQHAGLTDFMKANHVLETLKTDGGILFIDEVQQLEAATLRQLRELLDGFGQSKLFVVLGVNTETPVDGQTLREGRIETHIRLTELPQEQGKALYEKLKTRLASSHTAEPLPEKELLLGQVYALFRPKSIAFQLD